MFNQNQFIMKKLFTLFAAMVTFVALNAQNTADLGVYGFFESLQSQTPSTEITLGMNDDLKPYVAYYNAGPAGLTSNDTIVFYAVIDNQPVSLFAGGIGDEEMAINNIYVIVMDQQGTPATILDKQFMDDNSLTGTFEVCVAIDLWSNTLTDANTSNNTACLTVHRGSSTGISEVADGEVNVYPNPATTVINIDNAEGAQISVYDLSGRMVSNVESASANQTIDASNLAKGMYIVRIANGNNVITKKVNVVR